MMAINRISRHVLCLGDGHFNHYVAGHEKAALIECGMSAGIPAFAGQWKNLPDQPQIAYLAALHSHFDHVCGIPLLRQMFPDALVVASSRTQKVLRLEKVRHALKAGDRAVADHYFRRGLIDEPLPELAINLLQIDETVQEGDQLNLGDDLRLQFLEVPGHSPCSIAAYLPEDQVMFVSDAAGTCLSGGVIAPVFFQDYGLYINSIKKVSQYPIEVLAVGHGEIIYGSSRVKQYLQQAIGDAERAFEAIEDALQKGSREDELAEQLYATYIVAGMADYPRPLMLASMAQLIKNVQNGR